MLVKFLGLYNGKYVDTYFLKIPLVIRNLKYIAERVALFLMIDIIPPDLILPQFKPLMMDPNATQSVAHFSMFSYKLA